MDLENQCPSMSKPKFVCAAGTSLFIVIVTVILVAFSVHTVQEGSVGVYFLGGKLDESFTYPGVHSALPFITRIEEIPIRPTTEVLDPVSTVTRDGIENIFHNIQGTCPAYM